MTNLRILRVIASIGVDNGGPINGLVNSSRLLVEYGHDVHVASFYSEGEAVNTDFEFSNDLFLKTLGPLCYSKAYKVWLLENLQRFDIVIIHGIWQWHSYITAKICKELNTPYVLFTHGMLDPYFNKIDRLKHIKKQLYWLFLERFAVNNANAVLFTSKEEMRLAAQSFSPYSAHGVVVSYGCSPPVNNPISNAKIPSKPYVLFLSRIHPKKGVEILLNGFAKSALAKSKYKLVIAGTGDSEYVARLATLAKELGINEQVIWPGLLQGEEKAKAFASADLFVLPSYQENFGIVLAEAMSYKLPVITTKGVNIFQEIEEKKAGLICDANIDSFTKALDAWFFLSDEQRKQLSINAETLYLEQYSINSAAKSLENVLFNVLNSTDLTR